MSARRGGRRLGERKRDLRKTDTCLREKQRLKAGNWQGKAGQGKARQAAPARSLPAPGERRTRTFSSLSSSSFSSRPSRSRYSIPPPRAGTDTVTKYRAVYDRRCVHACVHSRAYIRTREAAAAAPDRRRHCRARARRASLSAPPSVPSRTLGPDRASASALYSEPAVRGGP